MLYITQRRAELLLHILAKYYKETNNKDREIIITLLGEVAAATASSYIYNFDAAPPK